MRCFVAIEISEEIKESIAKLQSHLPFDLAGLKIVKKSQMHLTLKFLGEVQQIKLNSIKKELNKVKFAPFQVHLGPIGVFPNEDTIRVVWAGLRPEDKILELQRDIDDKLKGLFKRENGYKPHVTLARARSVKEKKRFLEKLAILDMPGKKLEMVCFKLIKSILTQNGPVYEVLDVFD
jgi:RNA 2',3'-cyclic 3'-phosphodiesterase